MTRDPGVTVLLSVKTLAKRWDVSQKTVRRLIWGDELKAVRLGQSVRVPLDEVERYERSRPAA